MKPFRILSIDGGGIKGVFPAAFLAAFERTSGLRVLDCVEMIVGTSTGGILALGLGVGFSAEEMLDFYRTHGPRIFPSSRAMWLGRKLKRCFRVAYDPLRLRTALQEVFGERKLGDAKTKLVIPATSASTGDVYIFKTPHHPRFLVDVDVPVVDVAMATAAAPTFFPQHMGSNGVPLLDGGLWANNPVMVGVVEAISILRQPMESLRVLSLGCTATPKTLSAATRKRGGTLKWAEPAFELIAHGQAATATNQARLLLGKPNILRVQPIVPPGFFELDFAGAIPELKSLGHESARNHASQVKALLADSS